MKNHVRVEGKLLQTNKKWSHMKQQQKEWIYQVTKEEYDRFIQKHKRVPRKSGKEEVIDKIYERINERDIWIPYHEAKTNIGKFIDRQNRKPHDIIDENGETVTVKMVVKVKPGKKSKPKPPTIKFECIPDDLKEEFYGKMKRDIALYINQAAKMPPNKIRDSHITQILRVFNSKQYKKIGAKILSDDSMLSAYSSIRKELFAEYQATGPLHAETKKDKLNKSLTVLETERLILRKMHMGDAKEISLIISDIKVMYAWERAFATKKDTHDWIIKQCRRYKNEQVGYYLAVDKSSGAVVGQIGLMWNEINDEKVLEVGSILKKEYWHMGYATEGARACLEYGFSLFDTDKITAAIRPENTASIAVAERLDMKLIGEYDKEYDGKLMKHLIYGISKEYAV